VSVEWDDLARGFGYRLSPIQRLLLQKLEPKPERYHVRGFPRLKGPAYSDVQPVLRRGKLRTLALKNAQVINFRDLRANLYGCYPCPRCGEVRYRTGLIRAGKPAFVECHACGDRRPVRVLVG
jgi:hypothetical protein